MNLLAFYTCDIVERPYKRDQILPPRAENLITCEPVDEFNTKTDNCVFNASFSFNNTVFMRNFAYEHGSEANILDLGLFLLCIYLS